MMNSLAIDTSTKKANVCLKYGHKLTNESIDNEITHSEKLLPLIDKVLNSENKTLKDLTHLACTIGPGSFTGIRIGIATIKAFAKALNTPVFAVSSLDVLAYINTDDDYVISIMDAKNSRIYYSIYKIIRKTHDNVLIPYLEKISDYCNDTIDVALEKISTILNKENTSASSISIIGDCVDMYKENFIDVLTSQFKVVNTYNKNLSADVLVNMLENYSKLKIADNYTKNYLTLDAIYVRPSQAERAKNNEA